MVTFTMTSPTTFIGTGRETDTYQDGRQLSYNFKVVDGSVKGNSVSWVCDSADLNGKWRLRVTLASDGLTMKGVMTALSGDMASGPGRYTRVLSDP